MNEDPIRTAAQAVLRLESLVNQLDQSYQHTDWRQVSSGVRHEVISIRRALTAALAAQEAVQAVVTADSPGKVRSDAPATSRRAARVVRTGSARYRVLAQLAYAGPQTDWQLQQSLRMNPSTERPRRGELVDWGLVMPRGVVMHGDQEWREWGITLTGRAVCRSLAEGNDSVVVPDTPVQDVSTTDEPDGDPVLF